MRSILGALLIPALLAVIVIGAIVLMLNSEQGKASTAAANATAIARIVERATPMSDEAFIAVEGLESVERVAIAGFDSNVKIAQSADVSQSIMAQAMMCNAWAWPVGLIALGFVLWMLKRKQERKE